MAGDSAPKALSAPSRARKRGMGETPPCKAMTRTTTGWRANVALHRKLVLPVACIASQGLAECYYLTPPALRPPVGEPKQSQELLPALLVTMARQPTAHSGPGAKHPIFSRSLPARGVVCACVCAAAAKSHNRRRTGPPPLLPYFSHCHRLACCSRNNSEQIPGSPCGIVQVPPPGPVPRTSQKIAIKKRRL